MSKTKRNIEHIRVDAWASPRTRQFVVSSARALDEMSELSVHSNRVKRQANQKVYKIQAALREYKPETRYSYLVITPEGDIKRRIFLAQTRRQADQMLSRVGYMRILSFRHLKY